MNVKFGFFIRCKTMVFTLMLIMLLSSSGLYAQKLNIDAKSVSLIEVLNMVKAQAGYKFVYTDALNVNAIKVTVNVRDEEPLDFFKSFFPKYGIKYKIDGKLVTLSLVVKLSSFGSVKGVVRDTQGNPVSGVVVTVKNKKQYAISDADGKYFMNNLQMGDLLTFTILGFKEITVAFSGSDLDIIMEEGVDMLEDVVVTGYQTISKERVTGSFNIIPKDQLSKPTSNIASRIIGTMSGVQATTDINGDPTFEIRGQTSLYANAQPLIVVDGFPIEGDFKQINPNDVESITVLKDAAASSIWGARSANGVIVIVTKKGAKDKRKGLQVDVSSFVKVAPKADLDYAYSQASSSEVIDYEKMIYNKWGSRPVLDSSDPFYVNYSPGLTALNEHYLGYLSQTELDNLLDGYKKLDNRKQLKKYILQTPITHQHNVNISSQNDRVTNVLSLMYEDDDYYLKGNSQYKMMVNYRMNAKLFKWLEFNFSGTYNYNKKTNNSEGLPDITPYEMLVNPDGSRINIGKSYYMPNMKRYVPMDKFPYPDWGYNPITEMENQDRTITDMNARIQAGLRINIIEGLNIDSKFQYELYNTFNRDLYGEETFYVRQEVNEASTWNREKGKVTRNLPIGDILKQSRRRIDSWYFRNQLNFNRAFGKHAIAFIAGTEVSNRVSQFFGYPTTYGYNDDKLIVGVFPNGPGNWYRTSLQIEDWRGYNQVFDYVNSFEYATDRYFSLYGNLSYTFDEKYTLSGSVRTDASNLITDDPKYRYAPFWSVGASWQIGKEEFMKEVAWLDRLNLRATYGFNGNVDKSTSFKPLINMYSTNPMGTNEPYAVISSYGNPTLRWEKTGTLNVGIDYSVLRGKLFGKIDFYNKYTKDLIASISIPAINGTEKQKLNNAEMLNRGFELEIGSVLPITEKIKWTGNLNLSYNKNKITKLFIVSFKGSQLVEGGISAYMEGENANTLWAYDYAGVYNDGTEASPNWQPKIQDKDGNLYNIGKYSAISAIDAYNACLNMGTKVAPWILGFSNSFRIYDFDFSFIMTAKFGHKFRRQSFNYLSSINYNRVTPNRQLSEIINCDPMERVPLPMNGEIEPNFYMWSLSTPYMSYLVENAGLFRIQEINLTYNLPRRALNKIGLSNLQIYAMVNNAFSIYANSFGEDPEFPRGGLKPQPVYTFGLKLQF